MRQVSPENVIAVRGYQHSDPPGVFDPTVIQPTRVLCFDTETDITPSQTLRVGCYIDRDKQTQTIGLFYDEHNVTDDERATLKAYAESKGYDLITAWQFAYHVANLSEIEGCHIVGFNLPFDISRIATRCRESQGRFRNGFTFDLATSRVRIKVKHISARKSLYGWGGFTKGRADFVDVMTLGSAMLGRSHSLASLSKTLKTKHQKSKGDHGETLTADYLEYNVNDVLCTLDCYDTLKAEFDTYGLSTPVESIFSEASLGKAYLREFGITPHRHVDKDFPPELTGQIVSTYYGGRSEVHIRHKTTPVVYTDFLSMYPTVCSLMHLWKYVIGGPIQWKDNTDTVTELIDDVYGRGCAAVRNPSLWSNLVCIVQVSPCDDIFPVRSRYNGVNFTIGLNHLTSGPLWFTLADVVSSVLLTGRKPRILRSVGFSPGEAQSGLRSLPLLGREDLRIDPYQDDFYRRLIELRKASTGPAKQAIKIIANSTCYGIFVEVTPEKQDESFTGDYYSYDGVKREKRTSQVEKTGAYFHPLLASVITGAARLLLATSERLAKDSGIDWVFCDTDSMAFATHDTEAVSRIVDFFEGLSPYSFDGSILKVEDINEPDPLYCYAVSAKRYVLFSKRGGFKVRKASAHGLGFLQRPYGQGQTDTGAPEWINDLWSLVVHAGTKRAPDYSELRYSGRPAISQYTVTTANLYRMLKGYNEQTDRPIRPFGFIASYLPRLPSVSPLGPFLPNVDDTLSLVFDRNTLRPISREELRTYEDVLQGFHTHPESKFLLGDSVNGAVCSRRHVVAKAVEVIGKESNRIDPEGWKEPFKVQRFSKTKHPVEFKRLVLKPRKREG